MRDILITAIVFASLPFFFKRPYVGVLMWIWISVMNPHTQTWGFAATFPYAMIIAITLMCALIMTKEPKGLPSTPVVWTYLAFVMWMNISAFFAIQPELIMPMWVKVTKIMLMNIVVLMLLKTREHVHAFIWMIALSLGFYGVKGGIFTLSSGGQYRVWGPGGFIGGNNEIALALVITVPLLYYLFMESKNKWVRYGLLGSMLLCSLAALGSYSRGAFLAIGAMAFFLWFKSNRKVVVGFLLLLMAPVLLLFMPDQWFDRMNTITEYSEDGSAMGRINAWHMAFNLAKDRPLVGGGFEIYDEITFQMYAPNPLAVHAAHSIYFQALGEHGFVGLALYLLLGYLTWSNGTWVIRKSKGREDLAWAGNLCKMIQVSFVGFAVGGAFLSLLYFDVPYYLMIAIILIRKIVEHQLGKASKAECEQGQYNLSVYPKRMTL